MQLLGTAKQPIDVSVLYPKQWTVTKTPGQYSYLTLHCLGPHSHCMTSPFASYCIAFICIELRHIVSDIRFCIAFASRRVAFVLPRVEYCIIVSAIALVIVSKVLILYRNFDISKYRKYRTFDISKYRTSDRSKYRTFDVSKYRTFMHFSVEISKFDFSVSQCTAPCHTVSQPMQV